MTGLEAFLTQHPAHSDLESAARLCCERWIWHRRIAQNLLIYDGLCAMMLLLGLDYFRVGVHPP